MFKPDECEYTKCACCDGDDYDFMFEAVDNVYHSSPNRFKVVRCRQCGLVYTNPRPTEESIASFYPSQYYAYQAPSMNLRKRIKAFARVALPGYNQKVSSIKRYVA